MESNFFVTVVTVTGEGLEGGTGAETGAVSSHSELFIRGINVHPGSLLFLIGTDKPKILC